MTREQRKTRGATIPAGPRLLLHSPTPRMGTTATRTNGRMDANDAPAFLGVKPTLMKTPEPFEGEHDDMDRFLGTATPISRCFATSSKESHHSWSYSPPRSSQNAPETGGPTDERTYHPATHATLKSHDIATRTGTISCENSRNNSVTPP